MYFLSSDDALFAARNAIIWWTHIIVWPIELAYGIIGDELERRGHSVK